MEQPTEVHNQDAPELATEALYMKIDRGRVRLVVSVLAVVSLAACSADAEEGGTEGGAVGRVINVETSILEPGDFTEVIRLSGTVEANRDVTVAAEESGVVRELLADKGTPVREGQPILKIDDRILFNQVEEARARADLASETWERRKRLWEEDGIGTELAYLEARFASEQASANLALLEERLDRTTVTAPVEGVLDDRFVEVGSMVSPGTPVARIVDLDPVKITAGVPERYASDVAPGTRATVTFDVLDGSERDGTISFVGAAVNPDNRTFPVEFTLSNPGHTIKPEMVAEVSVVRRELANVIVVPQEALIRVEDGFVTFVVVTRNGQDVAEVRPVVTGPSQRNQVVITEGLEGGERLVIVGQQTVAAGDVVRIVGEP
jgi:membrane fusion protein (multidrug efflux system)